MSELRIIQIKIVSTGKAVLKCAYCGGTGGVPKDYKPQYQKVCPVCKGIGAKPIAGSWKIIK